MPSEKNSANIMWKIAKESVLSKQKITKYSNILANSERIVQVIHEKYFLEVPSSRYDYYAPQKELLAGLDETNEQLFKYKNGGYVRNEAFYNHYGISIDFDLLPITDKNLTILAKAIFYEEKIYNNYTTVSHSYSYNEIIGLQKRKNILFRALNNMREKAILQQDIVNKISSTINKYLVYGRHLLIIHKAKKILDQTPHYKDQEWLDNPERRLAKATENHDIDIYRYYIDRGLDPKNQLITKEVEIYYITSDDSWEVSFPCNCKSCLNNFSKVLLAGHNIDLKSYKDKILLKLASYQRDIKFNVKKYFGPFEKTLKKIYHFDSEWNKDSLTSENIANVFQNYLPKYYGLFSNRHHKKEAAKIIAFVKTSTDLNLIYDYLKNIKNNLSKVNVNGEFNRRLHFCLRTLKPLLNKELSALQEEKKDSVNNKGCDHEEKKYFLK